MSLFQLVSTEVIPSDKKINKLTEVTEFYFTYYNKIEDLWYHYHAGRLDDTGAQKAFYKIKKTEKQINTVVNEIVKSPDKKITQKADLETRTYLSRTFNV